MMIRSSIARRVAYALPPRISRPARRVGTYLRSWRLERACRAAFAAEGQSVRQPVLFIAGLPKSGTTWLEQMVEALAPHRPWILPDATGHEYRTGGSHDFDLPSDFPDRVDGMLTVIKMHVHGSERNIDVLRRAGIRPIVLHRDLRDVAVSYCHYVGNTPWHPDHGPYRRLSLTERLERFGRELLPAYCDWIRTWQGGLERCNAIELRYEDMLLDPHGVLGRVNDHWQLGASAQQQSDVIEAYSFKRMSRGRESGQDDSKAFVRKGVAGDWCKEFTPSLRTLYGSICGDLLIDLGHESDHAWHGEPKA
ncbi:MAG: sulfotransferase domain-containing protein [Planctomycetota bacterium]|nr:sulfotransferase domain-containing protein [Planctomycetota bacterium]